jgi:hypothetical protein
MSRLLDFLNKYCFCSYVTVLDDAIIEISTMNLNLRKEILYVFSMTYAMSPLKHNMKINFFVTGYHNPSKET